MSKVLDSIKGFTDAHLMPLTMRLVDTKFIQTLKDGMIYIMPALITGSFSCSSPACPSTRGRIFSPPPASTR